MNKLSKQYTKHGRFTANSPKNLASDEQQYSLQLSVIIVNYNSAEFIRECLNALQTLPANSEIIIVDNYSFDDSPAIIQQEFKHVNFIQNIENKGFAKAVNQGFAASKGKYIALLNPDAVVQPDSYDILLERLSDTEIGIIGPKILNSDGTLQFASKRSFPTPTRAFPRIFGLSRLFPNSKIFGSYDLQHLNADEEHDVDSVSGAMMLFHRRVFEAVGGFDERFFLYAEDDDFCFRVKEARFRVLYCPKTSVTHSKGGSQDRAPFERNTVFHQAMLQFFDKYKYRFWSWRLLSLFVKMGVRFSEFIANFKIRLPRYSLLFFDLFTQFLSFSAALIFWFNYQYSAEIQLNEILKYGLLLGNYCLFWIVSSHITGLYHSRNNYTQILLKTAVIAFFTASTSTYFFAIFAYSRATLLIFSIFSTLGMLLWRRIIFYFNSTNLSVIPSVQSLFRQKILLLAPKISNTEIADLQSKFGAKLQGICSNDISGHSELNLLGRVGNFRGILQKYRFNGILFTNCTDKEIIHTIGQNIGEEVRLKAVFKSSSGLTTTDRRFFGDTVVDTFDLPLLFRPTRQLKRNFDVVVSGLIMLVFPISLLVYLFSKKEKFKTASPKSRGILLIAPKGNIRRFCTALPAVFMGKLSFIGCPFDADYCQTPLPQAVFPVATMTKKGANSAIDFRDEIEYLQRFSLLREIQLISTHLLGKK